MGIAGACALGSWSGCATVRGIPAPEAFEASPAKGVAVLRVMSNRGAASSVFEKWHFVRVRNVATGETHSLSNHADPRARHGLYLAALGPGRYRLDDLYSTAGTMGRAPLDGLDLAFSVEAGRLTDLGMMVFARPFEPLDTKRFAIGLLEAFPGDRQAVLDQLPAALAARLGAAPSVGWSPSDGLQAARGRAEALRGDVLWAESPSRLPDGSTAMGEPYGQVRIRSAAGVWRRLQLPTTLSIRALHGASDGTIWAGADESVLLRGRLDGDWTRVALPVAGASVAGLQRMPGSDDIAIALQTRNQFLLAVAPAQGGGAARTVHAHPRALAMNLTEDPYARLLPLGDALVLCTGNLSNDDVPLRYSVAQPQWTALARPSGGSSLGWIALPGGDLARFTGLTMTNRKFERSSDGGQSWQVQGRLDWLFDEPVFVTPSRGYATPLADPPRAFLESGRRHVWRTDDGGLNWRQVAASAFIGGPLIGLGDPDRIAHAGADGRFRVSQDGGATWREERPA